jgi:hypothetical protein
MARGEIWRTVSLKTLSGLLDVRSRPADIPPGALRWRQGFMTSSEGKLCTRDGFSRAWADKIYENGYHNHDLHHQDGTREPITYEYECTASDGTRTLFAGAKSWLKWLDETSGTWTTIASGLGAGDSYWQGGCLQDVMVFCNGVNDVLQHTLGTGTTSPIPDLAADGVTAAHVVVEFNSFIFIMNYTDTSRGRRLSSVRWCDLNAPTSWALTATPPATTLAGVQDLDYGDEILAAKPMLGSLYIYTRRAIWRVTVSGDQNTTWNFTAVYREPKNQTGCLVYPRTLVSTGSDHYYLSRDSVYHFNPYMTAPERDDWTRRADGVIFKKADTVISAFSCNSPCGEYRPAPKELWFSWPSVANVEARTVNGVLLNDWTLVLNTEQQAADTTHAGYTAMVNYRRNPTVGQCNEIQDFICASSTDLCLKSIGGVFYWQFITTGSDITADLPEIVPQTDYYIAGYPRVLRGLIPLGVYDRQKALNNVLLDHDTTDENQPCVVQLRIGNSYKLVDPNDPDPTCSPQWRVIPDLRTGKNWISLACPTPQTNTALAADNLKPFDAMEWQVYEQNVFLYWEVTVMNQDGTPAIGADSCLERIDFRAMALPSR